MQAFFLIMWRELLWSRNLYSGLMEAMDEVGNSLGLCIWIISTVGEVVGYAWYAVSQESVCVGKLLVRS